jgi:hypothetical protein
VKKDDPNVDLTYAADIFAACWWQLLSFVLVFIWFDWRLISELARKSIASVAMVDFLYYLVKKKALV